MKKCSKCKKVKPFDNFHKSNTVKRGYHSQCKPCRKESRKANEKQVKAYRKKYYEANKNTEMYKKYRENSRKVNYLKRYSITIEDYNLMLEKQENKCKICKIHQDDLKKRLFVDHCHSTNEVRGLLCHDCNTALGFFKDNTDSLEEAIIYLKENKKGLK